MCSVKKKEKLTSFRNVRSPGDIFSASLITSEISYDDSVSDTMQSLFVSGTVSTVSWFGS